MDTDAEACLLYEQPVDPAYEALVDRSVALQNEICPKVYPRDLTSANVMTDPVLGPKAREIQELGKQFMLRMNDLNSTDPRENAAQEASYKVLGLRLLADIGRVAGTCGHGP